MTTPIAFIDLETTGLNVYYSSIIELGAIVNGVEKSWFVRIPVKLSQFITDLTRITDHMLETEGVPLKTALVEFMAFITNDGAPILVGHNLMSFDRRFLLEELTDCGLDVQYNQFKQFLCVDTLYISQYLNKSESHSLAATCKALNITINGVHRALYDCRLTCGILNHIQNYDTAMAIGVCMHAHFQKSELEAIVAAVISFHSK